MKNFIEINYTGKVEGNVFDSTDEKIATEAKIHSKGMKYGPIIVCLGEGQLLPGLDEFLKDKKPGKYEVKLEAEKAFGKKSSKLLQLVPMKVFKTQNIRPYPGLMINVDGNNGVVKTVSGGRVIVDFNHPLASKDVEYEVEVIRKVEDLKEQVTAFLKTTMNNDDIEVKVDGKNVEVILKQDIPKEIKDLLSKKLTEITVADKVVFRSSK